MKKIKFFAAVLAMMAVPTFVSASSTTVIPDDDDYITQEQAYMFDNFDNEDNEEQNLSERLAGTVWKYYQEGDDIMDVIFYFEGKTVTITCGCSERILDVYEEGKDYMRIVDWDVYIAMKHHHTGLPIQLINGELYHGNVKMVRIR